MNKTELIEELAERTDSSIEETRRSVDAFESAVAAALGNGEEVRITGFGKFYVQERGPREGTNPQTNWRVHIPASKVPKFKAGNVLKRAV